MKVTKKSIYINDDTPFLRPFICQGDFYESEIMLAGINPATPISPQNMSLESYLELLSDHGAFMKYYSDDREKRGKSAVSRTRQGIKALNEWVFSRFSTHMIETNINTFPTASVKELKKATQEAREKGRELFWEVLVEANAKVLIVHGKSAFVDLLELLCAKNVQCQSLNGVTTDGEKSINELEEKSPIIRFTLPNREVTVFVIRHLMYYGSGGESYSGFKERLSGFVSLTH